MNDLNFPVNLDSINEGLYHTDSVMCSVILLNICKKSYHVPTCL